MYDTRKLRRRRNVYDRKVGPYGTTDRSYEQGRMTVEFAGSKRTEGVRLQSKKRGHTGFVGMF